MQQLVFDLARAEPPSFDNFVCGSNAEVVAAVKRFAQFEAPAVAEQQSLQPHDAQRLQNTSLLLWGHCGAGKSHLLHAAVRYIGQRGVRTSFIADCNAVVDQDIEALATSALVAVDNVDLASPAAQAQLFTLYNTLRSRNARLLAASTMSLASLPIREDVRTRLGWGLVYALAPLSDAEKPGALLAYSQQRGFRLSDEVIGYLLSHGRRDMTTLLTTLAALDRHSLSIKRPITVPLLRDWLQRDMPLSSDAQRD